MLFPNSWQNRNRTGQEPTSDANVCNDGDENVGLSDQAKQRKSATVDTSGISNNNCTTLVTRHLAFANFTELRQRAYLRDREHLLVYAPHPALDNDAPLDLTRGKEADPKRTGLESFPLMTADSPWRVNGWRLVSLALQLLGPGNCLPLLRRCVSGASQGAGVGYRPTVVNFAPRATGTDREEGAGCCRGGSGGPHRVALPFHIGSSQRRVDGEPLRKAPTGVDRHVPADLLVRASREAVVQGAAHLSFGGLERLPRSLLLGLPFGRQGHVRLPLGRSQGLCLDAGAARRGHQPDLACSAATLLRSLRS